MYKYKVSVVMAVYNVEPFLKEAIDSVIAQDIGFEHIQLILVNDGSVDNSGKICDEYAEKYPENIVVVHKENGGVSSARNAGVKYAEGKYLNFMDADDKLSANTCRKVCEFFDKRYDDFDVVAFPMYFFDGAKGPHILNNKFDKGSRTIDLRKEYQFIQLSTASSFLKRETFMELELEYDERLKFTEDAKLLARILAKTRRMGVVSTCRYHVRRRSSGSLSATQQSASRKEWWLDTIEHFQLDTIAYFKQNFGEIPQFVQYLMMYDLQWRLQQQTVPQFLLDEDEIQRFHDALHVVLTHIDDKIIWEQKNIWHEHKAYALRKKYGKAPEVVQTSETIQFYHNEREILSLADRGLSIAFLEINENTCRIDGQLLIVPPALEGLTVEANINDTHYYPCTPINVRKQSTILGEDTHNCIPFRVEFPLDPNAENFRITFVAKFGNTRVKLKNIKLGRYVPVVPALSASYFFKDNLKVSLQGHQFVISRCTRKQHIKSEIAFLKQLYSKKPLGGRKAIVARLLVHFLRIFKRKPLILISDRIMRGGDNGEALFRYIQEHHKRDVNAVFVISKKCEDYARMKKIGKVVNARSHAHSLLHMLCDYNVSSSAEIQTFYPFEGYDSGYKDQVHHVKSVFLQHGITKDDISGWINRYEKNLHGVVAAANAEHDAFLEPQYCYEPENIWLTGFPRFDRLYHDEHNCIAIVPTWRKHLMGKLDPNTGKWTVSPAFYESDFLHFYKDLLSNPRLHAALKKYNYKLQFLPHPNMMELAGTICESPDVEILGTETQYRDLYAKCKLIVTDYSSVVFDFVYLRKPIVYAHFDAETFFGGAHSYERGYFDYERDGFGEVEYNLEATVDRIIEYIKNDCKLKDMYRTRIDRFFAFDDQNNCQRVYEKIKELCNLKQ